ncbi:MAG: SDR family NAD(P)-dependent oxidoreductase [Rhodospirillaceae bacterium]|nr:SDR family NAD(P)-dependent oxidoreductase [Rhodospirillaceae bacterium]MCY4066231.1 SDR family NAD(P)-dependent oxidoreductase [Rhodospirillaceae bacterium]
MKTVLITGCSSGIGLDAARTLHRRGWRVFATCRQEADCDVLQAEGLESFRLDYSDPASIDAAMAETLDRCDGALDALFNNGAYAMPGAAEDFSYEALEAIFRANLFGPHELARRAIRAMRPRGRGRIVNCSSVLGFAYLRFRGAYTATKHAMEGLTDTLRLELRGTPIEVSLILPGPIRTSIREKSRPHYEKWIDRENSAWREFYDTVLEPRLYDPAPRRDPGELGPEAVTAKLIHALESPKPKARYYVTRTTWVARLFRIFVPAGIRDRVLERYS